MNLPYFYEPFSDSAQIQMGEQSAHHALHVLRMKAGDELLITNGEGCLSQYRIRHATKKDCQLEFLKDFSAEKNSPANQLHIAISFTKNPARIEWFLEKATEIGIQSITPLITKRSEKTYFKRERYEKIIISAMLQSQQLFLPKLNEPQSLEEVIMGHEELKLIAHCREDQIRIDLKDELISRKNTLILIGPEGDFTEDEIHLCTQKQCKAVSLGSHRLRTETAGLFACVVFNTQIAG